MTIKPGYHTQMSIEFIHFIPIVVKVNVKSSDCANSIRCRVHCSWNITNWPAANWFYFYWAFERQEGDGERLWKTLFLSLSLSLSLSLLALLGRLIASNWIINVVRLLQLPVTCYAPKEEMSLGMLSKWRPPFYTFFPFFSSFVSPFLLFLLLFSMAVLQLL